MVPEPAVFTAIASPRRREILRMTWEGECGAGEIRRAMPEVSWGAVSLQLRALTDAGLLTARAEGRHRFYRADRDRLAGVADLLQSMWNDVLWRLKLAAELEATRRGPTSAKATVGKPRRAKAKAGKPGRAKAKAGQPGRGKATAGKSKSKRKRTSRAKRRT